MAPLAFPKVLLALNLVGMAMATPCAQSVNIFSNEDSISVQNLSPCASSVVMINGEAVEVPPLSRAQRSLHQTAKTSTSAAVDTQGRSDSPTALQETGKLLQLAALLPAETLQVLRKVAVPILNTTLAVPANLLESAATMSIGRSPEGTKGSASLAEATAAMSDGKESRGTMAQARSLGGGLSDTLALLKLKTQKSFSLHKNVALGPFSLKKVLEFGLWKKEAATPPPKVVTEAPPVPAEIAPVTTPVPAIPAEVPPAPVGVVPAPGAVVAVVAPQPPKVDSTKQIAIVQNSPPAENLSV